MTPSLLDGPNFLVGTLPKGGGEVMNMTNGKSGVERGWGFQLKISFENFRFLGRRLCAGAEGEYKSS